MSEQTVEAPPLRIPDALPRAERRVAISRAQLISRYPWIAGTAAIVAISTVIVLWARTRPGYDPYGWLVWGHLTIHLDLNTNGAPSWKPLPYLFTVPYALAGRYAMWLWMITAVSLTLAGVVFAWRIAFRLTEATPQRRYAAYVAGLVAAVGVLGIRDYSHFVLSAQSDPPIVGLCLAAIDCWLCGRRRWAFWLWFLGSLGRPEVWPFFGLYALWSWRTVPEMRRQIVAGFVLLLAFWFGIPALTSKSPFTAGNLAQSSPRALKTNKFFGTIDRFFDLHELPVQLAALLATLLALLRRRRFVLLLAGGAVFWVLLECAFALHGWPAVPRYLFEPVAVTCILAGIFIGRMILELPPLLARGISRLAPLRVGARSASLVGGWGAALVLIVFGASMLPPALSRYRIERRDLVHERARTRELGRLAVVVDKLGPSRIYGCGRADIPIGYQSVFAFYTGTDVGHLYLLPSVVRHPSITLVSFRPLSNGWRVFPRNVLPADVPHCHGLRLTYHS